MAANSAFPRVTLDITLAELYQSDDHIEGVPQTIPVLVNAFPSSDYAMTSQLRKNIKYIYQDSELAKPWSEQDRDRLQRILAIKLLSVLGQRYTFAAGNMPVVLFDPDVDQSSRSGTQVMPLEHAKLEALRTSSVFPPCQRPQIRFYAGPMNVRLGSPSERLAVAMPFDGLEGLPHVIRPEIHYDVLSKGCLAESGLPTPRSELVQLRSTEYIQLMASKRPGFFSNGLADFPRSEIEAFQRHVAHLSAMVAERVHAHIIPLVVKSQLTTSCGGTYIVRTTDQCEALLEKLKTLVIPLLISSILDENAHLAPATIIISDYIHAINSYGLTFFVTRSGNCKFIGCANQEFDDEGFWTGGLIEYLEQDRLEVAFESTMRAVGEYLHFRGYFGPVGIDVLEDAKGGQWVVDMNVRTPGSLPLGVLKGHFSSRRGLQFAYILLGIRFPYSRDGFLDSFRKEIEDGKIVVVAWYEEFPGQRPNVSWANLTMAGENRGELARLLQTVKDSALRTYN